MRDDPYSARSYGRHVDESFMSDLLANLPYESPSGSPVLFPRPLPRVLLLLMSAYLCSALFLIFAVTSYAAPLGSATITSGVAASCVEAATIAAQ